MLARPVGVTSCRFGDYTFRSFDYAECYDYKCPVCVAFRVSKGRKLDAKAAKQLQSLGGEFFRGDWTAAQLIFAAIPGVSRFGK